MTARKRHVWSKADRERITGYVELWRGLLHLNGWHIVVTFSDQEDAGEPNTAAELVGNYPYRSSQMVRVFPRMLDDVHEEQCRKILHELVHIITRPMRAAAHDLVSEKLVLWRDINNRDEHTVDWLTNIIYALANEVRVTPPKKKRKR